VDGFARGRASLSTVEHATSPEDQVEGFPYLLNTGRVLQQYNVGTMTRRTPNAELAPADELEIHPDDAARERIADGDPVGIESRWGRVRARASRRAFVRACSSSRSTIRRRTRTASPARGTIRFHTVRNTR
jgi:predicted molibdopterin-dependent oxidoreductase YjgC